VKLRYHRLEAEKHSVEHHWQGRWSLDSMTACMREGEGHHFEHLL